MCPKIARKFLLETKVETAFTAIYKALNELGLKKLAIKYSLPAPPSCPNCAKDSKSSSLQWIPQYERWFCYTCREYASPSIAYKPSYLILEYWQYLQRSEIELDFEEKQASTEVHVKWYYSPYGNLLGSSGEENIALGGAVLQPARAQSLSDQAKDHAERLCEVLMHKIGAREIQRTEEEVTREVVKEKEIVVKVRCDYCHNLYDEKLDKCPHCGGKS